MAYTRIFPLPPLSRPKKAARPMARCSECEAELSKETCSQNQWKRAKKDKPASCLQCLPVPSAEAREAKKHAEVQAFYRATSGGAQDGVERCKNGRKRKAAAPTARMRERGAEVLLSVRAGREPAFYHN